MADVNPKPLIIEFFGLPGSGKSTIAQNLSEKLNKKEKICPVLNQIRDKMALRSAASPARNLLRLSQNIFSDPIFSYYSIRSGLSLKSFRMSRLKRSLVLINNFAILRSYANSGYQSVILEEGVLQNVWSFGVNGEIQSETKLKEVIDRFICNFNYAIVFIEADLKLAEERIAGRTANSRLDKLTSEELHESLKDGSNRLIQLLDLLPDHVHLLKLPASSPVQQNVDMVESWLEEILVDSS